jgi:acetyl-CoA carboxylase carboxyl transferase subunit alpha
MNQFVLDFEKPIVEIERRITELREYSVREDFAMHKEIEKLEEKARKLRLQIYSKLTRWQRYQLARHPNRPYTLDYIGRILTDFIELHGDRAFGDDPAIVAGLGKLDGHAVALIGHQKARDTKEKIRRNFGMPNPEGYRKALRVMKMAGRFSRPVICLLDTPGAYPGIGAEERGQAEAIARNLFEMAHLPVPIVVIVIGEGASGGALGIGVGDRILMMENTWYSVISPEGCAAILYRDSANAPLAAEAMRITPNDLLELNVIDKIIKEPLGGAHNNWDEAAQLLKDAIKAEIVELAKWPADKLVKRRVEKFGQMGVWIE